MVQVNVEPDVLPSTTSAEENTALVQCFYEEIFNLGNLTAAEEIVSPDFVDHIPSPLPDQPTHGPEAIKWFATMYRNAFPDLRVTLEDVMTCHDRVITRVIWEGTQKGQLFGADPTGRKIRVTGIDIARVAAGRLVEHWGQIDVIEMLAQLGFLPMP